MRLLHLSFLCVVFTFFYSASPFKYATNKDLNNIKSTAVKHAVAPAAANIIYQSKDGGQTWEDVSHSLPERQQPEGFFAGESELYVHINKALYRSKSNLHVPVWEKVQGLDPKTNTITFNRSEVMAYSNDGYIYRKKPSSETWMPIYTSLKSTSLKPHEVAAIFETSDGSVFLSTGKSLSKSTDKAQSWKLVQNGFVGDMVESDGVLLATGQKGIMRSTDNGDHWEWVVSEGGVGIALERIEGGFAAITYNTKSESRRIRISMDAGKTWQAIDNGIQASPMISSIKQVGNYFLVAHPDGIFRSADKGKTWHMVHEGVEPNKFKLNMGWNNRPSPDDRKVFTIYVSGNIVYAVAREGGC